MMRGDLKPMIKKCYPSGKQESEKSPRPNELSTLIFHLETHHSKIPRATSYLAKKTASYASHNNLGSLLVSIRIVRGIVSSKCRENLDLFAPDVLDVVKSALSASKITDELLAEEAALTFKEFNASHTGVLFAGHPDYAQKFLSLVTAFNNLTSEQNSRQVRLASIDALRSLTESPVLATRIGQQALQSCVPTFYSLIPPNVEVFHTFNARISDHERRVRESGPIPARTADFESEKTASSSGSTGKSDGSQTGQSVTYKALDGLRSCVNMNSSDQLARVFSTILHKIIKDTDKKPTIWNQTLVISTARWCELQLRFSVLKTLVTEMVRLPVKEVKSQLVYSELLHALLDSDVSKVGLSVLDMLRQLLDLQHRLIVAGEAETKEGKALLDSLTANIGSLAQLKVYPGLIMDMISEILTKYSIMDQQLASQIQEVHSTNSQSNGVIGNSQSLPSRPSLSSYYSDSSTSSPRPPGVIISDFNDINEILKVAPTGTQLPVNLWVSTHWILTSNDPQLLIMYATTFMTYLKKSPLTAAAVNSVTSPNLRPGSLLTRQLCQVLIDEDNKTANYIAIYYCIVAMIEHYSAADAISVIPWILEVQTTGEQLRSTSAFQSVAIISVSQALLLAVTRISEREAPANKVFDIIESRVKHQEWLPGIIYPAHIPVNQAITTAISSETPHFSSQDNHDVLRIISVHDLGLTDTEYECAVHPQLSLQAGVLPEELSVLKPRARSVSGSTLDGSTRRMASSRSIVSTESSAPRVIDLVSRGASGASGATGAAANHQASGLNGTVGANGSSGINGNGSHSTLTPHKPQRQGSILGMLEQLNLNGSGRGRLTTT